MLYNNTLELIGNTPLVKLNNITKILGCNVYAKIEKNNLSGSIKDRAAYQMLKEMIDSGTIHKGDTIIEETSGNTGIGLACLSNYFGLHCIIVMPSSASNERRDLIKNYNAELVLVDGGMTKCVEKAEELNRTIKNSVIIGQFDNSSNPKAHYLGTGKEIIKDLPNVDVVIAGIGTGGTISGIGHALKEYNPSCEIIGIQPSNSPVLTGGNASAHLIQGIGPDFIPTNYKKEYVDRIVNVEDNDAIQCAKELVTKECLFVGISSGAALAAVKQISAEEKYKGKNIVLIFPDSGERYSWN